MTQPFNHIIVVFRNDDISALSDVDHEQRVSEIFEQYKIPQTIGVIPLYTLNSEHDPKGNSLISLGENRKQIRIRDRTPRLQTSDKQVQPALEKRIF
jgi:hypothetical protein